LWLLRQAIFRSVYKLISEKALPFRWFSFYACCSRLFLWWACAPRKRKAGIVDRGIVRAAIRACHCQSDPHDFGLGRYSASLARLPINVVQTLFVASFHA
jgi:hypothetical protein